jgi:exopolyphosphatase/pppGpp-phosphohydrolase
MPNRPTAYRPLYLPVRGGAAVRPPFDTATCPKRRAAERWVREELGSVEHERRVAEIAARFFHLTRPLHPLNRGDLRLLQLAAVVHDVGRAVCDETHPEEGAKMVLTEPSLPVGATERRHLAYLTLYHKGPVPEPGRDELLGRGDDAIRLRTVLALLRAADALDGRAVESPRLVFAMAASRTPRLQVTCYLNRDSAKARKVYGKRKKFRLLEERMGCRVEVDVVVAEAMAMVA